MPRIPVATRTLMGQKLPITSPNRQVASSSKSLMNDVGPSLGSLATPHRPIAAPAHHERFRLLGQTAECAAANQRRRRQVCQSSCSPRTPARPQRRAAPSLSSPSRPRRRTPHSLTRRQLVKMPACTPLSCMSPALRSGSVTYGSMPQRTRTPFLRSNTLQQKPRNMN